MEKTKSEAELNGKKKFCYAYLLDQDNFLLLQHYLILPLTYSLEAYEQYQQYSVFHQS
jgi:hypothetical protein